MKEYTNGAGSVKRETPDDSESDDKRIPLSREERLALRTRMGLITTDDLKEALGISKETLSKYRRCGLRQHGSRQKFYRLDDIADAIARSGSEGEADDASEA